LLVYDLVLLVPHGRLLFADGAAADDIYGDGQRINLTNLAIHLTLVDPATRLWHPRRAPLALSR